MFTPGDKLEFGHYTILRELGSGGTGVVYLCRDEFLQREIAIKMLLPELMTNEETVELFYQEARLAAQLEHPNIVTIHSIGHENRGGKIHHYMAMEYLPGGSLRTQINGDVLNLEKAVEWMRQLTIALDFAHKRGVVHQDIKPDNIFITQSGDLKIGDFGLALIISDSVSETSLEDRGTPAYMSPEFCRGEERDHRADIYSLGLVFFEILTGEHPYNKAKGMVEMALKHATAPVPSLRKIKPDLPIILEKILKHMLAKGVDERLQSLAGIIPSLEKLLLELKVVRMGVAKNKTETQSALEKNIENETIDFRPEAEKIPATSLEIGSREEKKSDTKLEIESLAKKESQKEKKLDLLWSFNTLGPIGWLASPVLNRQQKHVYVGSADGAVYALDMSLGNLIWHYQIGSPILSNPILKGEFLYCVSSDGTILCVNSCDGKKIWQAQCNNTTVSSPVFAQELMLICTLDGNMKVYNSEDGSFLGNYRADEGIVSSPQVEDNIAFFGSKDGILHAIDLRKGFSKKWSVQLDGEILASVLASTDSVYAATVSGSIYCFDFESGNRNWHHIAGGKFLCRGSLEFTSINYCTDEGEIFSLDKYRGNLLWKSELYSSVLGGITINAGKVYIATKNGYLYCLNTKSGELIWFYQGGINFDSAPLVTSTVIYQAGVDGSVLALAQPAK